MSRVISSMALAAAVSTVACGATTGNTGAVSTPGSTSQTTQTAPAGPTEVNSSQRGVIPAGQELDVRLQAALSSETAKPEQRFEATTVVDVTQNGQVLIPAGSVVRGVVSSVDPAGRGTDRTGKMTLSFDQITVRGRAVPMRAMATNIFKSGGIREEAGTAGAGAGVGGIIGGILGGVSGAVVGAAIGAGGAILATDGKDVELPAGSVIRLRLDQPVRAV
jgi:hypothetical protein